MTLARPYAKAVFQLATEKGNLDDWADYLQSMRQILSTEKVNAFILSPSISVDVKIEKVSALFGKTLDKLAIQFLELLIRRKRVTLIDSICTVFEDLKNVHENVLNVECYSAYSLTAAQKNEIKKTLEKKFSSKIELQVIEDTNSKGGVLLKAGDTVIDSSVAGRLHKLALSLLSK